MSGRECRLSVAMVMRLLLLCLVLAIRCDAQCNFRDLHGIEFFVEYTSAGQEVIVMYNDATDVITTTTGTTVEIIQCASEDPTIDLFNRYIFTKVVNGGTVYICAEQRLRGDYLFVRKLESNESVDAATCVTMLEAAPHDKYIFVRHPISDRPLGECRLYDGTFHGVYGTTQPPECSTDVTSIVEVAEMMVYIDTCFPGPTTYEEPHHATISCHTRASADLLGGDESFTVGSVMVNGRTDLYCMSTREVNGVIVLNIQIRQGHLVCSSNNPQFSITLLADQCSFGVCQNNANCTQHPNGYTCTCLPGYTGQNCSTDINECGSSPCNSGVCVDHLNGYTCNCTGSGFMGDHCQNEINECSSSPCQNGATCNDEIAQFTCICAPGYTGDRCQMEINECLSLPCLNGGRCIDQINSYVCTCRAGYMGVRCETEPCESGPCENGATCDDLLDGYVCNCLSGYTGVNCEIDVDECTLDPCLNGGTCFDLVDTYTCDCPSGFEGHNCETQINECSSQPCLNGGRCMDQIDSYVCICVAGYTGINCETEPCESGPCENGATCDDLPNGYVCNCISGYTGVNCETDEDECALDPCLNGGTCVDMVDAYTCDCPSGFEGHNCETNIPDCVNVNCSNGICEDGINDFTCVCAYGFDGEYCDIPITYPPGSLENDIIPLVIGIAGCIAAVLMLACVCLMRNKMKKKKCPDKPRKPASLTIIRASHCV